MSIRDQIGKKFNYKQLYDSEYGLEIETETKKAYQYPEMHFWEVKNDGSLRDFGVEYVLKTPLNYGAHLDSALQEFYDKTKKINFIQDSISTSVHVHWNVLPETWKTVGNFLTLYTLTENILIEYAGEYRRNNLFCLPIRSSPIIVDYITNIFLGVKEQNYLNCSISPESAKYASLNLSSLSKFGSLEIRCMRGITDIKLIKDWVSIINCLVTFSRQDLVPPVLLDIYKESGEEMIADIFGNYYKSLKHQNLKELLEENLFRAGKIGYCLTEEQWKNLDKKPEKKVLSEELLNKYALDEFGLPFKELSPAKRDHVIFIAEAIGELLVLGKKKKAFNPAGEIQQWIVGNDFNING